MKKSIYLIGAVVFISALALIIFNHTKLKKMDRKILFKNDEEIVTQNNDIYSIEFKNIVFKVNSFGGRIISFRMDQKEMLAGQEAHGDNFGSTLWPSPQSIWGWPPPAVLDSDIYSVFIENNAIVMTSNKDEKLGYQFIKRYKALPEKNAVEIIYSIQNISNENKSVATWEISRFYKGGIAFYPAGEGLPSGHFKEMDMTEKKGIVWFESKKKTYDKDLKSMQDGHEGWLAFAQDGYLYIKQFPEVGIKEAAPGEGEIEIYINPTFNYIELEAQSKYVSLLPGESFDWRVVWYITKIKKTEQVIGNENMVKKVREIITPN